MRHTHLVVVGAVGGLLHGRVLLVLAHLHAHHGVHVQAYQLPGFDHSDADLWGEGDMSLGVSSAPISLCEFKPQSPEVVGPWPGASKPA